MTPATEIELLVYTAVHLVGIPIVVVGLLAIGTMLYLGHRRERRRKEWNEMLDKLFLVSKRNWELVHDAVHFTAARSSTGVADLNGVVSFIVKHRDTHDGSALRRHR